MVKEYGTLPRIKKVILMKENIKMIKNADGDLIVGQMEMSLQDNLRMICGKKKII
jgi:hypothetical protein